MMEKNYFIAKEEIYKVFDELESLINNRAKLMEEAFYNEKEKHSLQMKIKYLETEMSLTIGDEKTSEGKPLFTNVEQRKAELIIRSSKDANWSEWTNHIRVIDDRLEDLKIGLDIGLEKVKNKRAYLRALTAFMQQGGVDDE